MTASIPGPPPPPSGGGGGNLIPRKVWGGVVEFGDGPRADQPQRVACYWCVMDDDEPSVPQVYVMVGGYSACVRHARKSGTG